MNLRKNDLVSLSDHWIEDARILYDHQRWIGALHAAGIALECLLKARIAKATPAEAFPDKEFAVRVWTHKPAVLLAAGGLIAELEASDPRVRANWGTVKDWDVGLRYDRAATQSGVLGFLDALDDPQDGLLTWLRRHC